MERRQAGSRLYQARPLGSHWFHGSKLDRLALVHSLMHERIVFEIPKDSECPVENLLSWRSSALRRACSVLYHEISMDAMFISR